MCIWCPESDGTEDWFSSSKAGRKTSFPDSILERLLLLNWCWMLNWLMLKSWKIYKNKLLTILNIGASNVIKTIDHLGRPSFGCFALCLPLNEVQLTQGRRSDAVSIGHFKHSRHYHAWRTFKRNQTCNPNVISKKWFCGKKALFSSSSAQRALYSMYKWCVTPFIPSKLKLFFRK